MAEQKLILQRTSEPIASHTHRMGVTQPSLPMWESFTNTDRQRLVQTLLQMARELATAQVHEGPELGR
jgi:hypothetical protein